MSASGSLAGLLRQSGFIGSLQSPPFLLHAVDVDDTIRTSGPFQRPRSKEIQFGVESALDIGSLAKPMLFPSEQEIADRRTVAAERRDHGFGLVRRHDGILVALEENHRLRQPPGMEQRRALAVESLLLGIGSDQPVEIARLELVRVPRQGGQRRLRRSGLLRPERSRETRGRRAWCIRRRCRR